MTGAEHLAEVAEALRLNRREGCDRLAELFPMVSRRHFGKHWTRYKTMPAPEFAAHLHAMLTRKDLVGEPVARVLTYADPTGERATNRAARAA